MTEFNKLLESIAETTADYRAGELDAPSPDHVERWVNQFNTGVRLPILQEMDHVLKECYFSKEIVTDFFSNQIKHKKIAGNDPCSFWQSASVFDIQQHGHSQSEIRQLFGEALLEQCGLELDAIAGGKGVYIYLDDVIFTGGRVSTDLSSWVRDYAPTKATVHILVLVTHRLGEWLCEKELERIARASGKDIDFHFWAIARIENRKKYKNNSETLWPANIPEDEALAVYIEKEDRFPFEPREPGGKFEHEIFSSETGRQLLEKELLMAGIRIRGFCQEPKQSLRPLGFGPFGLGFGSTIVTFRNCPNNCPLALWWGDPEAPSHHPFSRWYPLFPRKTYSQEFNFEAIDF